MSKYTILDHLEEEGLIMEWEAYKMYGIKKTKLKNYITELRKSGHKINKITQYVSSIPLIEYELVLENHLTRSKTSDDLDKTKNANPLVLNIMIDKFNKKYRNTLNKDQRNLLESKLSSNNVI